MKTKTAAKSHLLNGYSCSLASLVLACSMIMTPRTASATWPVIDAGQLASLLADIKKYKDEYDHWKEQIISLGGLKDSTLGMTDTFTERSPTYLMAQTCKGGSTISLSSLMSAFSLNPNGKIKEQQREICQRIVLSENAKYNESVKMLKKVRKTSDAITAISEKLPSKPTKGEIDSLQNNIDQLQLRASADMQYTTTVITAYDNYIASLQQNQTLLTKSAMSGNNGDDDILGMAARTFVQGAVLKTALSTQRTPCPSASDKSIGCIE
jgi:hypothetical protein